MSHYAAAASDEIEKFINMVSVPWRAPLPRSFALLPRKLQVNSKKSHQFDVGVDDQVLVYGLKNALHFCTAKSFTDVAASAKTLWLANLVK